MKKLISSLAFVLLLALAPNTSRAEEPSANVFPPYGECKDGDNVVFRTNPLRFECKSGSSGGVPAGTIAFFALAACPDGWAITNGGNGTVDLRGEFLRVWDAGKGLDPGRTLGSIQGDAIRNITGTVTFYRGYVQNGTGPFFPAAGHGIHWPRWENSSINPGLGFDLSRAVPTANENRPHNIALLACQKM